MKRIIAGPCGSVAYFEEGITHDGQYRFLNVPDCRFSRGENLVPANDAVFSNVIMLPRQLRSRAALAMFGAPTKRES